MHWIKKKNATRCHRSRSCFFAFANDAVLVKWSRTTLPYRCGRDRQRKIPNLSFKKDQRQKHIRLRWRHLGGKPKKSENAQLNNIPKVEQSFGSLETFLANIVFFLRRIYFLLTFKSTENRKKNHSPSHFTTQRNKQNGFTFYCNNHTQKPVTNWLLYSLSSFVDE